MHSLNYSKLFVDSILQAFTVEEREKSNGK